jgi:hypothetical protein
MDIAVISVNLLELQNRLASGHMLHLIQEAASFSPEGVNQGGAIWLKAQGAGLKA